jgi:hypothetical protein
MPSCIDADRRLSCRRIVDGIGTGWSPSSPESMSAAMSAAFVRTRLLLFTGGSDSMFSSSRWTVSIWTSVSTLR